GLGVSRRSESTVQLLERKARRGGRGPSGVGGLVRAAAIACLCGLAMVACTTPGVPTAASSNAGGGGLKAPKNPYPPFPYDNSVQKDAFRAFLRCAKLHGVVYRGPYADSRGRGAMIGPAKGERV